jgi:D-alanyl-D-alanine carboxypeptidase
MCAANVSRVRGRKTAGGQIAAVVFALLLHGLSAPPAQAGEVPEARAADAALDAAITELVAGSGGPPGVISVVQRGEEVKVHTAGVADVSTGAPPAISDHMQIASVSKAFSGAAAVAAVKDRRLSLDDTIGERLPNLPQAWKDVSLAQALQHKSGLPDFTTSPAYMSALQASPFVAPPPAELLAFVQDRPLEFRPGSTYRYSNSDNIVVQLMIEAATGRTYADVLQEKVYAPLGLTNTSLPNDNLMPSPYIHGYEIQPPDPPNDISEGFSLGWVAASGGMVSTPADMNLFVRAYASGATANKGTVDRQFRFVKGDSVPKGPGVNGAGLGIFRYRTRCGMVYGHTGVTFGYTQFAASTVDGARSATVSINSRMAPSDDPQALAPLVRIFELAVCAARAGT